MRATRQQIAAGVDVIKIYGSTGSADDVTGFQTYTYEEMKAAVDIARERGKRVAIHSYGPDGARDAVRAGAQSVEHAIDIDDATLREMARRGVTYVPTVDHNRYYAEHAAEFGYGDSAVAHLNAYRAKNLETVRRSFPPPNRLKPIVVPGAARPPFQWIPPFEEMRKVSLLSFGKNAPRISNRRESA